MKSPGQKRLDDSVLHFLALWQDEPYTISFHLSDGTVEVREKPVQGRISSSNLLLRRIKVPKNVSFSADFVNVVDQVEFLSPADFLVILVTMTAIENASSDFVSAGFRSFHLREGLQTAQLRRLDESVLWDDTGDSAISWTGLAFLRQEPRTFSQTRYVFALQKRP